MLNDLKYILLWVLPADSITQGRKETKKVVIPRTVIQNFIHLGSL